MASKLDSFAGVAPDLERNVLRCAQAVLVGIATYYAVSIVSAVVTAEAEARVPVTEITEGASVPAIRARPALDFAHYAAITERDVFNAPKPRDEAPAPIVRRLPPLRAKLLGVAPSPGGRSFAIVEDPGARAQTLLAVGDEIQGRTLARITRNAAVFASERGREEFLELPLPPRSVRSGLRGLDAEEADDGTPRHSEAVLPPMPAADREASADPSGFADAQMTPEFRDGQLLGVRISAIVPNSAYHQLGFKNGDLVGAIDGKTFVSPLVALQAVRTLRERRAGVVGVTRSRGAFTLDLAAELDAARNRGADDQEAVAQVWNWKAEASLRSKKRNRSMSSAETVQADRAVSDREEERIRASSPADWNELDLVSIPVSWSEELPTIAEPAGPRRSDDREYAPIPVTDMRLVHAGAIDLDHADQDPNLDKEKQ